MPTRQRYAGHRPGRPAARRSCWTATSRSASASSPRPPDLPKSTASRLVAALERHALVQRDGARGPLRPGPVLLRFAPPRRRRPRPGRRSPPLAAARWPSASGETINLAVPTPHGRRAPRPGRLPPLHRRRPTGSAAACRTTRTAVGKVFLAFGARAPPGALERFTPRTIAGRDRSPRLDAFARAATRPPIDELEVGLVGRRRARARRAAATCVAALSHLGPELPADESGSRSSATWSLLPRRPRVSAPTRVPHHQREGAA